MGVGVGVVGMLLPSGGDDVSAVVFFFD